MNNITTVGIDLAKNVFSVHGVDAAGAVVLRKTVTRARLSVLIAQLPPCLIGMEACSGAHDWARAFLPHGQIRSRQNKPDQYFAFPASFTAGAPTIRRDFRRFYDAAGLRLAETEDFSHAQPENA